MLSNLDRYKKDLDNLLNKGRDLQNSMNYALDPDELSRSAKKKLGDKKGKEFLKTLPSFRDQYQAWYSEAKALIRLLLPDRLEDFVRHYEKPKGRKDLTNESYRIDDYLQGLGVTRQSGLQQVKVVGLEAASPHLRQQVAILTSVKARFESSLFDIRQLVQADLFDSELDAAKELAKHKFNRAAGALAGVVLERHLRQQVAILTSVKARFESSLFDIRQLVQADLFDSELDAAKELAKHKFNRAAGALAGVVLERHRTGMRQPRH